MKNMHLPLSDPLHAALMREAQASGKAATTLVREAVERMIAERERQALDAALTAYIAAEGGGPHDLDEELENAGVEYLLRMPN